MKISIVTTTINTPEFIDKYWNNLSKSSAFSNDINFIVVGDNRTSREWKRYEHRGTVGLLNIEYWSPQEQDIWLTNHYDELHRDLIPENNPRRRNFGYLRAMELDSDITITIDDDNIPIDNTDWLQLHLDNLNGKCTETVYSYNRCINPCNILSLNHDIVYLRGYPISKMFTDTFVCTSEKPNNVVLNMGLWKHKPDVDSWTNIIYKDLHSKGTFNKNESYNIARWQYSPINTQNTSFKKDIAPLFWNMYQENIYDLPLDRYDDIWNGLFISKLIHKMNDDITFGQPIVNHLRNTHNYDKDLEHEFIGASINNKIWDFIMDMDIYSDNYVDGYLEIANALNSNSLFSDYRINKFIITLASKMRKWIKLTEVFK